MLIDPAFAGRYLRVVDHRYGRGTIFAGVGHPSYYPLEIASGPTVSLATVGKIAPAIGPPEADCGPPPLFNASISSDGSAQVSCTLISCHAILTAHCRGRSARAKHKLVPSGYFETASATVRLRPAAVERLEGCRVSEALRINGRAIDRRNLRLGPLPVVAAYPEAE